MAATFPADEAARLSALHEYAILDTAPEDVYDDITRLAAFVCGTPISGISLIDAERQWFKSILGLGLREIPRAASFCAHVISEPDVVIIEDATQDDRFRRNPFVVGEPYIRFYMSVPLVTEGGYVLGALCVADVSARRLTPGQETALGLLARLTTAQMEQGRRNARQVRLIAGREECRIGVGDVRLPCVLAESDAPAREEVTAITEGRAWNAGRAALEAARVREGAARRVAGFSMLDALVVAVDNKDRYTRRHSEDVMGYSLLIAGELGMSDDERRTVAMAALLHDVGKIGVPDEVLRKPGPLTDEEFAAMRQYPMMGALIVQAVPGLEETVDPIRHHHERWDGEGYPFGLRGDETPLAARLIAVADAFSAMTTDTPYRKRRSAAEALSVLTAGAGTQWSPTCVRALQAALRKAG